LTTNIINGISLDRYDDVLATRHLHVQVGHRQYVEDVRVSKIRFGADIAWAPVKDVHPHGFYKTCAGLYVSNEFSDTVLERMGDKVSLPASSGSSHDLNRELYDMEIQDVLHSEGVFFDTESEVGVRLWQMICKQSHGEDGDLVVDGNNNLLYLRRRAERRVVIQEKVVHARWSGEKSLWSIGVWKFGGDGEERVADSRIIVHG